MTINYMKRFNSIKDKYRDNINSYVKEVNKNKDEAEIINKKLKNEIKKLNLLKYTGVRTCINKYINNMSLLNIKVDKEIELKEEVIEILEIKEIEYEDFNEYIDFDKKNNIEKIVSIVFNFKEIDSKVDSVNQENKKILLRNQVMILDKCYMLDDISQKIEYIKELLQKISEVETEFYKSKDKLVCAMKSSCEQGISKEIKLLDNYRYLINKIRKEI